jgi:hypothetical protein
LVVSVLPSSGTALDHQDLEAVLGLRVMQRRGQLAVVLRTDDDVAGDTTTLSA